THVQLHCVDTEVDGVGERRQCVFRIESAGATVTVDCNALQSEIESGGSAEPSTGGGSVKSSGSGAAACGGGSGVSGSRRCSGAAFVSADNGTSHSQQSLHRLQRSQRWLAQVSFVQKAQISVEGSPQMLQINTADSTVM